MQSQRIRTTKLKHEQLLSSSRHAANASTRTMPPEPTGAGCWGLTDWQLYLVRLVFSPFNHMLEHAIDRNAHRGFCHLAQTMELITDSVEERWSKSFERQILDIFSSVDYHGGPFPLTRLPFPLSSLHGSSREQFVARKNATPHQDLRDDPSRLAGLLNHRCVWQ